MFRALGRGITRHPLLCILVWLGIVIVGAVSALWGFQQGNLFQRMESSESMVPGSEADVVLSATSSASQGETVQIIAEGSTSSAISDEITKLHQSFIKIPGVHSVVDPISAHEEFKQAQAEAVKAAIDQALADQQTTIEQAEQQALATALATQPQLAYAPEQVRAEQEALIKAQARQEAEKAITQQATQAVDAQFDEQEDPAQQLQSSEGFAIILTLDPVSQDSASASQEATQKAEHAIDEIEKKANAWESHIRTQHSDFDLHIASASIYKDLILGQVATDLVHGEAIGLPVALILLLIVFGGAIAAGLPILSALASIAIAMGILWGVSFGVEVDSFVLNILSIIGLALSIDYGLLVVSRYREEVASALRQQGLPDNGTELPSDVPALVRGAVIETVATAGRTVSFSALTIACAISGLFAMKAPMLRMIGAGGFTVTLIAVLTATTLVPSLLTLAGAKLVKPSAMTRFKPLRIVVERFGDTSSDTGIFSRLGHWVGKRPGAILIVSIAILLAFASPAMNLKMRSNFVEYVPDGSDAQIAMSIIDEDFPQLQTPTGMVLARTEPENVGTLVDFIEATDGVSRVSNPTKLPGEGTLINFYMDDIDDQVGEQATDAVQYLRGLNQTMGYEYYVGGAAALQLDFNNSITADAPWALLIIVCAVLILMFLMTGSFVAPLTALLINGLSLVAGLGIGTLIFDQGWFGLPNTNGLETFVVACAAAFGFGLAMDYEVFLLARIEEFWKETHNNHAAVIQGLQRSGRIITAAAAIIVAVFVGFCFGKLLAIQEIGVVLAIIVIVDASLVRMLLVPALMTILDKWNWWAPKPCARIYERWGLKE